MISLLMNSIKMNTGHHILLLSLTAPSMNDIAVSTKEVIKLVKALKLFETLGPDDVHRRFVTSLFLQQSLDTSQFRHVCPI